MDHNNSRYARQVVLPEIGAHGQARLKKSKVLVIGAGGLGCPILQYLVAAGVGSITVLDDDVVCESNLHRQILFRTSDIGMKKVEVAKKLLAELNSDCQITALPLRLSVANCEEHVASCDIVLDGSDNFATSYLVNDACVQLEKPFVAASLFQFTGQLSTFNYPYADGAPGPSYRCLFPEPPTTLTAPNCQEAGILGSVAGTIASLQATEALKIIAGFGEPLVGVLYNQNFLSARVQRLTFFPVLETIAATKIRTQAYYDRMNSCMTMEEISYARLKELQAAGPLTLLDVREVDERAAGHIGGMHIPLGQLQERIAEVPLDKDIVCYCKSGFRSANALQFIEQHCAPEVSLYNLLGGMDATLI